MEDAGGGGTTAEITAVSPDDLDALLRPSHAGTRETGGLVEAKTGELKEPPWLTESIGSMVGPGNPHDSEACLSNAWGLRSRGPEEAGERPDSVKLGAA